MFVWGVNFAFTKHVLDHVGVGAFVFIRFALLPLLAAALLVIIFRNRIRATWPRREDLPRFVLCGLVGHALHISVVMNGMNLSTPFSSSLVLTSGPLFTLGILAALGAERLRARQVAGTSLRAPESWSSCPTSSRAAWPAPAPATCCCWSPRSCSRSIPCSRSRSPSATAR
jgi:drug/metabolite transporter (DMT)-like permease